MQPIHENILDTLNEAILNLDIQAIQNVLARISDEDFNRINDFEIWLVSQRSFPFDLAVNATIKRFFETGDNSSIRNCIQILNLLKQRGWNARLDKASMRKVYTFISYTNIRGAYMNVRNLPSFNDKDYVYFTSTLINELQQRFECENENLNDYLNELILREKQLHPNTRFEIKLQYMNQIAHLKPIHLLKTIILDRRRALVIAKLPFQEEVKEATNKSLDYENSIRYSAGIIKSLSDEPALFNRILFFLPAMNVHATQHLMEFVNPQYEKFFGTDDRDYLSCEEDETDYESCDEGLDDDQEFNLASKSKLGN